MKPPMMKHMLWMLLTSVLVASLFSACNSSEDSTKKESIKNTTDTIAHEAVETIQKPIDEANLVKELSETHNQQLKEVTE